MIVLFFGSTGGIGKEALVRLLDRGVEVVAIVRNKMRLPEKTKGNKLLSVIETPGGHLGLDGDEISGYVRGCDAVVSCLGHNMSFSGIYGKPKQLCVDTTRMCCESIKALEPSEPTKYIVVSTEGVDRLDGKDPKRGLFEKCVLGLLKLCLPPHKDNMLNIQYIHDNIDRSTISDIEKNKFVEFCVVRPSNLIDGDQSEYELHETLQNGIFVSKTTTRSNVGNFIADCVTSSDVWTKYRNTYPHILNRQT